VKGPESCTALDVMGRERIQSYLSQFNFEVV
jgi:hypothetical protein